MKSTIEIPATTPLGHGEPLLSCEHGHCPPDRPAQDAPNGESPTPEDVRVAFADIWGDMGLPGTSRHPWRASMATAHLGPLLTEREVREALGLSHRAASLALTELEDWGLVERVEDAPERPGPGRRPWPGAWSATAGAGSSAWPRSAGPVRPTLAASTGDLPGTRRAGRVASPGDTEAQRLRGWLAEIQGFVTLFDRACGRSRGPRRARSHAASRCSRASPTRRSIDSCDSWAHCRGGAGRDVGGRGAHLAGHRTARHARRQPHRTPGTLTDARPAS